MALKKKMKMIRILAIAGALVVLLSCVPVLPAAANDEVVDPNASYFVSGSWIFNQYVAVPDDQIIQSVKFTSYGVDYSQLRILPTGIRYSASSSDAGVLVVSQDQVDGKFSFLNEDYRTVSFENDQLVSQSFYEYLLFNATQYTGEPLPGPDPGDQVFLLKAGQWECNSLVMTGEYVDLDPWPDGLAAVPLNFTSSGQSFSSMSGQYDFAFGDCVYYDDSLAYKYSDLTGTAEASWQTEAYALVYLAADQEVPQAFYNWFTSNFKRVSSDPVLPTYYTTVNIYDSNGSTLLHSVQFSDTNAAPVASLSVTQDGCTISYGDQTSSWVAGDMTYYGFKLTAGSVGPTYSPGLPYMLPGGQASDVVINLYVADSEGVLGDSDPPSVIAAFFEIMIRPVMSFFQAEFVPGYSLGKICLFSLLLGLLFWFLAMHKS